MKEPGEHSWSNSKPRNIRKDGRLVLLHHCVSCGRDFAKEEGDEYWRAAHVGVFGVDILAEDVNEKWIGEGFPGKLFIKAEGSRGSTKGRPPQRRQDRGLYR